MDNIKQLQEERGKLAAQLKELADGQSEWSTEDRETWEQVNERYDSIAHEISAEQEKVDVAARLSEISAARDVESYKAKREVTSQAASPINEETRQLAFQAWARHQNGIDITDRHREAAQRCGVDPSQSSYEIRLSGQAPAYGESGFGGVLESRAQSVGTDADGGYLVPEGFSNELEKSMLAFGGPRRVARILRTASGNNIPWPTVNDTGNKGRLLAENAAITETAVTFGSKTLGAYKYSSDSVLVSAELMADSAFNLANEVGAMLGERIGRITAEHFTTGDASSKPQGIVTGAGAGVTAASASAITADEIIDLVHSVDPSYRNGPSVGFMMHDNVVLAIRKLKDSDGQYLWQPGLSASEPDRLLGFPVVVNQDMASSIATTAVTVLFGDMSKYIIRDAGTIRLYRLEERYRDNDQTGFVAFSRHDGLVLDAGTDPIKKLTQA